MEVPVLNQTRGGMGEEYPVVIKISPPTDSLLVGSQNVNNDIESRLAAVSLDVFPIMEAVTGELASIENAFEELRRRNLRVIEENGLLGQQLIASHSRERKMSRVHSLQEEVLSAQIASLQAQLASQAAERESEVRGLQNLLTIAQREKTDAVVAAQAVWKQQRAQLEQQNHALQNQIKTSQSQVSSLTNTNSTLQGQVNTLTNTNSTLQSQVSSLTNTNSTLQGQVNTLTAANTTLQGQVTSLTAANTTLQSQVTSLTATNSSLRAHIYHLENAWRPSRYGRR